MPQSQKIYLDENTGEPKGPSKKLYLDDNGDDIQDNIPAPKEPVDERGMLRKTWDAATNPLVNIPIGDAIDSPSEFRSPTRARIEGFVGGVGQGLVDDAVSPLGIATAGAGSLATKAGKGLIRSAGKVVEAGGKFLNKYNPILSQMFEPGFMTTGRKGIGSGLEYVGNKMRGVGNTIERYMPNKSGARVQNLENNAPMDFGPNDYNQYMPNQSGYKSSLDMPLQEGDDLLESFKVIRNETPETGIKVKPRVKPNKDGTFTNLDTGEVLDSRGDSIIEINGKPIDRNSSFFKRNRQ